MIVLELLAFGQTWVSIFSPLGFPLCVICVQWSRCGLQGPVLEPQAACWCGTYTSGCSQTQFLLCETGEIQRAVSVRSLELPRRSSGEPRQRHEVDGAELSAL